VSAVKQTATADLTQRENKKSRSALGVGVITLVTILVVLLLAAFSVLSLVSARSDYNLSTMATESAENYYKADSAATEWYAQLDEAAGKLTGSAELYQAALEDAGYTVNRTNLGELRVTQSFTMGAGRQLDVTVAVLNDKTTIIRQWQT
jgi:flagellar basal body-associated protein FliL